MQDKWSRLRKKEASEIKKSGKFPKIKFTMTCSLFHGKGHIKRGYPMIRDGGFVATSRALSVAPSSATVNHQAQEREWADQR